MEKFVHNGKEYRSRSLAALSLIDEGLSLAKAAKIVGINAKTVFAAKKRRLLKNLKDSSSVTNITENATENETVTVSETDSK